MKRYYQFQSWAVKTDPNLEVSWQEESPYKNQSCCVTFQNFSKIPTHLFSRRRSRVSFKLSFFSFADLSCSSRFSVVLVTVFSRVLFENTAPSYLRVNSYLYVIVKLRLFFIKSSLFRPLLQMNAVSLVSCSLNSRLAPSRTSILSPVSGSLRSCCHLNLRYLSAFLTCSLTMILLSSFGCLQWCRKTRILEQCIVFQMNSRLISNTSSNLLSSTELKW